jgi:hypothetical protein
MVASWSQGLVAVLGYFATAGCFAPINIKLKFPGFEAESMRLPRCAFKKYQ